MDRYHVEAYTYLRDHAKPVSLQDRADLAEVRKFGGVAESNIARAHVERHRALCKRPFVEPPIERKPLSAETKRALYANSFYKQQMALLGGTRTVAPVYPEIYPRPESTWRYEPQPRNTELWPEPKPFTFMTEEKACSIVRDHLVALAKSGLEVDMYMVLRVFSSFEAYRRAIEGA